MKRIILLFMVSIAIVSCNTDDDSNIIPYTVISKALLYGNGAEGIPKQNLVITDATAWNNLMASMDSVNTVTDQFTETNVDFSNYTIIAVFDEVRVSSGFDIDLNILQRTDEVVVDVNFQEFGDNALPVITQPFYIVKIEKSDLPIVFQ